MEITPRTVKKAMKLQRDAQKCMSYPRMGVNPRDVFEVASALLDAMRGVKTEASPEQAEGQAVSTGGEQ